MFELQQWNLLVTVSFYADLKVENHLELPAAKKNPTEQRPKGVECLGRMGLLRLTHYSCDHNFGLREGWGGRPSYATLERNLNCPKCG